MISEYECKGKGHLLTRCASTEEKQGYSSSTFANGVAGQLHASAALTLERPDNHKGGSRVSLGAYFDVMENVACNGIRSPDHPNHTNSICRD